MDYNERVDVVDLILQVLKEHEKNLDSIVLQLGETVNQQNNPSKTSTLGHGPHKLVLRNWFEFRDKCQHSDTIAFDIEDDKFKIFSLKNNDFYMYFETIPETEKKSRNINDNLTKSDNLFFTEDFTKINNGKLQCGLPLKVIKEKTNQTSGHTTPKMIYRTDPDQVKQWLSEELKTEKKSIIFGWIDF